MLYPDGRPADAELLAMMYDASLDRFYTHDLFFRVNFDRNIPYSKWNSWYARTEYIYLNFPFKSLNTSSYSYSELLIPSVGVRHCVLESLPAGWEMNSRAARPKMADDVQNVAITDVVFEEEIIPVLRAEAMDAGALEETGNVQVRQNFARNSFLLSAVAYQRAGRSQHFVYPARKPDKMEVYGAGTYQGGGLRPDRGNRYCLQRVYASTQYASFCPCG